MVGREEEEEEELIYIDLCMHTGMTKAKSNHFFAKHFYENRCLDYVEETE